ncbi:ISL3 family transposase [Micromonospora olivasterospora]|uniref:Transposase n=1 Tax=Micromonospora olivasterospora TaxID=1880 RepID=A0A562I3F7_MICOL|nr:ISL3 family transposase [Micromonospora olivasterospora]TWH65234.1 transposase [Micromonospora olivasterospora]
MRLTRVLHRQAGLERAVVEGVRLDDDTDGEVLVISARPRKGAARRCGRCRARAPWYDRGWGRRRWRHLDFGTLRVVIEAAVPRVDCAEHGPTVIAVPWARHGARFTTAFEDTAAWLAARTSASAVTGLLRIAWRSVVAIVGRVVDAAAAGADRLAGLKRIGIDEVAYRKGQRYLTLVVDHDTGRLVWAADGRDKATVAPFFDELGAQRAAALTHVSADAAAWIGDVVAERAPQAVRCLDPYHLVAWVTDALDEVRRAVWNTARGGKGGRTEASKTLKDARWALWKNPPNLTDKQKATLATIQATNRPLYRAYLLKEQFREIIAVKGADGRLLLQAWLRWASRSKLAPFVKLAKTIRRHLPAIHNMLDSGLSNARIEANNVHLRVLTRQAYGYHSAKALITMANLRRGGLCPPLPGRS